MCVSPKCQKRASCPFNCFTWAKVFSPRQLGLISEKREREKLLRCGRVVNIESGANQRKRLRCAVGLAFRRSADFSVKTLELSWKVAGSASINWRQHSPCASPVDSFIWRTAKQVRRNERATFQADKTPTAMATTTTLTTSGLYGELQIRATTCCCHPP